MQNKLNEDWHKDLSQEKDEKNENGEFLCWFSCDFTLNLFLHYITLINLSLSLKYLVWKMALNWVIEDPPSQLNG